MVDGDDIPELYAESNSFLTYSYLYWVYKGQLCEYPMSINGFSYMERGNLFHNGSGFQGCCFDDFLSIDRNTTNLIAEGDYLDPMIAGYESYIWNGVEVTQSEYKTAKLAIFDPTTAITPTTYYSYSDICKQITEW